MWILVLCWKREHPLGCLRGGTYKPCASIRNQLTVNFTRQRHVDDDTEMTRLRNGGGRGLDRAQLIGDFAPRTRDRHANFVCEDRCVLTVW